MRNAAMRHRMCRAHHAPARPPAGHMALRYQPLGPAHPHTFVGMHARQGPGPGHATLRASVFDPVSGLGVFATAPLDRQPAALAQVGAESLPACVGMRGACMHAPARTHQAHARAGIARARGCDAVWPACSAGGGALQLAGADCRGHTAAAGGPRAHAVAGGCWPALDLCCRGGTAATAVGSRQPLVARPCALACTLACRHPLLHTQAGRFAEVVAGVEVSPPGAQVLGKGGVLDGFRSHSKLLLAYEPNFSMDSGGCWRMHVCVGVHVCGRAPVRACWPAAATSAGTSAHLHDTRLQVKAASRPAWRWASRPSASRSFRCAAFGGESAWPQLSLANALVC